MHVAMVTAAVTSRRASEAHIRRSSTAAGSGGQNRRRTIIIIIGSDGRITKTYGGRQTIIYTAYMKLSIHWSHVRLSFSRVFRQSLVVGQSIVCLRTSWLLAVASGCRGLAPCTDRVSWCRGGPAVVLLFVDGEVAWRASFGGRWTSRSRSNVVGSGGRTTTDAIQVGRPVLLIYAEITSDECSEMYSCFGDL